MSRLITHACGLRPSRRLWGSRVMVGWKLRGNIFAKQSKTKDKNKSYASSPSKRRRNSRSMVVMQGGAREVCLSGWIDELAETCCDLRVLTWLSIWYYKCEFVFVRAMCVNTLAFKTLCNLEYVRLYVWVCKRL